MNRVYDVVNRARELTDAVIVGFSCGKDSLALLDLCCRFFPHVEAAYWYITPELSFHERVLTWAEKKYHITIHRIPHFGLSELLRNSVCRKPSLATMNVPIIKTNDVENEMRRRSGIDWIATGQKRHDSLERVAMLNKCNSINLDAKRIYPIAWWSDAFVYRYLKKHKIPLSAEYAILGHSYGGDLQAKKLLPIKHHFPDDYAKIVRRFPFVEAEVLRHEWNLNKGKDTK